MQIEMGEDGENTTASVTHHELFRYNQMRFRVKKCPGTFQKNKEMISRQNSLTHPYTQTNLQYVLQMPWQLADEFATVLRIVEPRPHYNWKKVFWLQQYQPLWE